MWNEREFPGVFAGLFDFGVGLKNNPYIRNIHPRLILANTGTVPSPVCMPVPYRAPVFRRFFFPSL
jgi:hypothetical protein